VNRAFPTVTTAFGSATGLSSAGTPRSPTVAAGAGSSLRFATPAPPGACSGRASAGATPPNPNPKTAIAKVPVKKRTPAPFFLHREGYHRSRSPRALPRPSSARARLKTSRSGNLSQAGWRPPLWAHARERGKATCRSEVRGKRKSPSATSREGGTRTAGDVNAIASTSNCSSPPVVRAMAAAKAFVDISTSRSRCGKCRTIG